MLLHTCHHGYGPDNASATAFQPETHFPRMWNPNLLLIILNSILFYASLDCICPVTLRWSNSPLHQPESSQKVARTAVLVDSRSISHYHKRTKFSTVLSLVCHLLPVGRKI